jgi:hypothetical protein
MPISRYDIRTPLGQEDHLSNENQTSVQEVPEGGFACLPATGRTFSGGVIALDGYVFRRVQLRVPMPMESGLEFAAGLIRRNGRPLAAFCGCELRIPARLPPAEFSEFNRRYIAALRAIGFSTDPANPAARTNMAPLTHAAEDALLSAFTFAVPGTPRSKCADFVLSGKPELASDPDRVIAPRDTSPTGMQAKAAFVIQELQRTVQQLGGQWTNLTAAQIYTQHPLDHLKDLFEAAGLPLALCAHLPGDPPVFGPGGISLEFEADVRSITHEEAV